MTFPEFNRMIKHFRKNYLCPTCKDHFRGESIYILGSTSHESLILAQCDNCGAHIIVAVSLIPNQFPTFEERKQHFNRKFNNNRHYEKISQDDVLDMQNFLKEQKGDLSKFLSE